VKSVFHFTEDRDTSGFFPQLAKWHDRDRYRMTLGTLGPMDARLRAAMDAAGVPCLDLGARSRSAYPMAALRLARWLSANPVDVFHAHLFDPAVVGLAVAATVGVRARVLTRHHSNYHTRIAKRFHVAADRACTALSHRVIAVSQHTAEHLIEQEGAPPAKVRAIHNGIDFDRVKITSDETVLALRRELAPQPRKLALMIGRMHPEKGYDDVLPAFRNARAAMGDDILLAVAGSGPMEQHYREMAAQLGLGGSVRFLGFRTDLPDLMAAADLVLAPSRAEAFGLAIAEALYLGTPVLSTRVGGIPEIVRDGTDGVLVPPEDPESLGRAIVTLLSDEGLRARLRNAGRERIRREFAFEMMLRKYESVYAEITA
jgi:glycosyltransferase involved in cell wall biosynthesis